MKMGRLRATFKRKRSLLLATILVAFLLLDGILLWYTFAFTTDEKKAALDDAPSNLIDVQRTSGKVLLLVTEDGVIGYSSGESTPYEMGENASDASIGYYTGAVAIATEGGILHYFNPGEYSPSFSMTLDGEIRIIGISETTQRDLHLPEDIVVVTSNATGTHVLILSVAGRGTVSWSYNLTSQVVAVSRSDFTRSFLLGLDNDTVYLFKLIQTSPRTIYHVPGHVKEVQLSPSGLNLAVLFGGDPSYLAMFEYSFSTPLSVTEVPSDCRNLQIQKAGSLAYLENGDEVIRVFEGNTSLKISVGDLHTYVVPSVPDVIFVSTHGKITCYKGDRGSPIWEAQVGNMTANLITDAGGSVLVGWGIRGLAIIDNSQPFAGSKAALFTVGVIVIAEALTVPIILWRKRLSKVNAKTLLVIVAGAMVGIAVTAILPDPGFSNILGGMAGYILIVAIMSAISTLVAWNSQAGLASIVIGFAVGLVISIPICLVAAFAMWANGTDVSASDFLFTLIANGLGVGLKTGVAGGVAGYVIRLISA
ncbi:MAG: hypothetical protein LUQ14_01430 [Methanomassiliicoccales archaeon]|nr:hypothetical protein [Methanomassiliicoccales archaeon]